MQFQPQFFQPTPPDSEVEPKTYYSQYPGSTFYDRDGVCFNFDGRGQLVTTSFNLQGELDKVAGKRGCPIWTNVRVPDPTENTPADEIQTRAAVIIADLKAAQKSAGG